MTMRKLIPALLISVALLPAAAAAKEGYKAYLTAKANQGVPLPQPAKKFSCSDKIYGVVEVDVPRRTARHTLYATWRNPDGEDQEFTEYPFHIVDGQARVWVWLKLHRGTGSSMVQFMNPSAGLEEFVGQWELHIQVDQETVARQSFEVIC